MGGLLLLTGLAIVTIVVSLPRQQVPLPAGATSLRLHTLQPVWRWPWDIQGCPLALLNPVKVARVQDAITFTLVATGQPIDVIWPGGFSGRLNNGTAEIVSTEGWVIAREGDVLDDLGGGGGDNDNEFVVCFGSADEYRPR